jgi:hypothetical protein
MAKGDPSMPVMNRNIITAKDVENIRGGHIPKALRLNPPAWADSAHLADEAPATPGLAARAAVEAGATTGPDGVPIPSEDDYLTKVLKYVPIEVLGAYLFMAGVIDSNVTDKSDHAAWLGYGLIAFGGITPLYAWRVLSVVRPTQLLFSVVGIGVYVFAVGGWFATTTWYHSWYAGIVVPLFALLVAIISVPALPVPAEH